MVTVERRRRDKDGGDWVTVGIEIEPRIKKMKRGRGCMALGLSERGKVIYIGVGKITESMGRKRMLTERKKRGPKWR